MADERRKVVQIDPSGDWVPFPKFEGMRKAKQEWRQRAQALTTEVEAYRAIAELARDHLATVYEYWPAETRATLAQIGIRSGRDYAEAVTGGMDAGQRELVIAHCAARPVVVLP
jgi:hypothetical protein